MGNCGLIVYQNCWRGRSAKWS